LLEIIEKFTKTLKNFQVNKSAIAIIKNCLWKII